MQYLLEWELSYLDTGHINYCAYVDSDGYVNLSKTVKNEFGTIQFKNQEITCKQLLVLYGETKTSCNLFTCFTNGEVEAIFFEIGSNCILTTLDLNDDVIKLDSYDNKLCTLTSNGSIRYDNTTVLSDPEITDFKIFDNYLFVWYVNSNIKLYNISNDMGILTLELNDNTVYSKLLNEFTAFIQTLFFCKDVLVLGLCNGDIACSKHYEIIKKTDYYSIIRIESNIHYYIGITDLNIEIFYVSSIRNALKTKKLIHKYTRNTCYSLQPILNSKTLEEYMSLQYKYVCKSKHCLILVMMDDIIRTFFKDVEVFDVFETYKKLYNPLQGSYI